MMKVATSTPTEAMQVTAKRVVGIVNLYFPACAQARPPRMYGHACVVISLRLVFKQGTGLAAPADVQAMSAATEQSFTYKMLRPSSDHLAIAA